MPFDGTHLNPTAAHLVRAKSYLLEHGWCSTGPYGSASEVCIAVALGKTGSGSGAGISIIGNAGFLMGNAIGVEPSFVESYSIAKWNDTPGRTIDEVLAAFDAAITVAMEEGDETHPGDHANRL